MRLKDLKFGDRRVKLILTVFAFLMMLFAFGSCTNRLHRYTVVGDNLIIDEKGVIHCYLLKEKEYEMYSKIRIRLNDHHSCAHTCTRKYCRR